MNITKDFTVDTLAEWIASLMNSAEADECFDVSWFKPTMDAPVSIVGGWATGFSADDADLFCMSVTNPTYAMCVKICENKGPYGYVDYELLDMPVGVDNEVEDTSITLEWDDDPKQVAEFFKTEWERLYTMYYNN